MRATFTDTQEALREALRDLLADHAGSAAVRAAVLDGDGFDPDLWRLLAGMGVGELPGAVEQGIVAEELGRVVAPVPYVEQQVAAAVLATAAPDHDLGADLASGDALAVYARDQHVPGRDVHLAGGALHGTLRALPHAARADHLLVEAAGDDGPVLALVEAGAVRTETLPTMDRTRPLCDVLLDGAPATVLADAPARASAAGAARARAATAALAAATLYAHDLVGVGQACLDLAVAHARQRRQFGRVIGTYQAVSHRLVDMYVALESARSHAYHAAWAVAAGEEVATLAASQAKAAASQAAVACAQGAIQVHGGIGFTWEHDLHLYLKRARSGAALGGGSAQHLRRVADLMGA